MSASSRAASASPRCGATVPGSRRPAVSTCTPARRQRGLSLYDAGVTQKLRCAVALRLVYRRIRPLHGRARPGSARFTTEAPCGANMGDMTRPDTAMAPAIVAPQLRLVGDGRRHQNRVLAAQRRTRAIQLVGAGQTYQQAADELGYKNRGTVHKIVHRALQAEQSQSVQMLRTLQVDRLEARCLSAAVAGLPALGPGAALPQINVTATAVFDRRLITGDDDRLGRGCWSPPLPQSASR